MFCIFFYSVNVFLFEVGDIESTIAELFAINADS